MCKAGARTLIKCTPWDSRLLFSWQQGSHHVFGLVVDQVSMQSIETPQLSPWDTTGRAAVWPLPRVPHAVLHQLPLHVKGLPTLVTGKHLVSRVCLFVLFQIAEIAEPSAARVTQVWLLSRVNDDVALDVTRGRKPLSTDFTDVWLLPRVPA